MMMRLIVRVDDNRGCSVTLVGLEGGFGGANREALVGIEGGFRGANREALVGLRERLWWGLEGGFGGAKRGFGGAKITLFGA